MRLTWTRTVAPFLAVAAWLSPPLGLVACGGAGAGKAPAATSPPHDLDADPLALLPQGAIVVASLDARALFDHGSMGAAAASVTGALVPVDDATLRISRDIDRITFASYPANDPDAVAVLSGRFDPARIAAATQGRQGAPLVRGTYAGFATSTVGLVTLAPVTAKTVIAGTAAGVHGVLDRIARGTLDRTIPPQTLATLQTPGAQVAAVADFATQPIAAASIGMVNLGWLRGLATVRAIGDFNPPGLNVAATLTYANPQQAIGSADGIRAMQNLLAVLAPVMGGARIQNLQVTVTGSDVACKFAVDEGSLGSLAGLATRFLSPP